MKSKAVTVIWFDDLKGIGEGFDSKIGHQIAAALETLPQLFVCKGYLVTL